MERPAHAVTEKGANMSKPLTPDEHRSRHTELHKSIDELFADYLRHHREARLSTTTLMQLMEWSYQQTLNPTEAPS